MHRRHLALLALPLAAVACSSTGSSGAAGSTKDGGRDVATVDVTLSEAGCEPRSIAAKAGPTTFHVTNDGTAAVTEFEVLDGNHILGEVENVIPGVERSFSLTLRAGEYRTKCPGGSSFDGGTLAVADSATGAESATGQARDDAVSAYVDYVKSEVDELKAAAGPFAAAVKAGDGATARSLFAAARYHYETIEPIAESFGDLDPAIDAREGDVPAEQWGGFHRIEKALWTAGGDLAGMGPVADKLVADIGRLESNVADVKLEPAQVANGAVELLNEVSTSKITGEEDRYSHTDLSDFAANLAGAKAAYDALRPLLSGGDASALAANIDSRFSAVSTALHEHRGSEATGNGYALYDTLTPTDTRGLSSTLDALAEPLSQVAAAVL